MTQGTNSVLFGCHSPIHSLLVLVAWRRLYKRWPSCWQMACIFLHDIGHWGTNYLDDDAARKRHSLLGAKIAKRLFGQKAADFILGHNLYAGTVQSDLHGPDKYAWVIAPVWWLMSNAVFEPKLKRRGNTRRESAIMFKVAMKENMDTGFRELSHEIYLRQWAGASLGGDMRDVSFEGKCPKCGREVTRDEVDIGVGTMYGSARCDGCGWVQGDLFADVWAAEEKGG